MLSKLLKPGLKVCITLGACLILAACATPAAWRFAEKQAEEPPTYRGIDDAYFAALRSPNRLRLCVLAGDGKGGEPSPATLKIDLQKYSNYLADRGTAQHNNTSLAYNSIGVGSKLTNQCEPVLQEGEELISIERIPVDGNDLTGALQQLAADKLTVFVLEQNGQNHIAVISPGQDYPGLNQEAFSAHVKNNASKAGYILLPFAVFADVVLGVLYLTGCIFGLHCS